MWVAHNAENKAAGTQAGRLCPSPSSHVKSPYFSVSLLRISRLLKDVLHLRLCLCIMGKKKLAKVTCHKKEANGANTETLQKNTTGKKAGGPISDSNRKGLFLPSWKS